MESYHNANSLNVIGSGNRNLDTVPLSTAKYFPQKGVNGNGFSERNVSALYNQLLANSREYELREEITSGTLKVKETIFYDVFGYDVHRIDYVSVGGESGGNSIYLMFDESGFESSLTNETLADLSSDGAGFYDFSVSEFMSRIAVGGDIHDVTESYAHYLDTKTLTPLAFLYECTGDIRTSDGVVVSEEDRRHIFESVIAELNNGYSLNTTDDNLLNGFAGKHAPESVKNYMSEAFSKTSTDGIYSSLMLSRAEYNSMTHEYLSLYDIAKRFWNSIVVADPTDGVVRDSEDVDADFGSMLESSASSLPVIDGKRSIFSSFNDFIHSNAYITPRNCLLTTVAIVGFGFVSGCADNLADNIMGEAFTEANEGISGSNTNPQLTVIDTYELLDADYEEHYGADNGEITTISDDVIIRKLPIGECTDDGNCLDGQFKIGRASNGNFKLIGNEQLGDWQIVRTSEVDTKYGPLAVTKSGKSSMNDIWLGNSGKNKELTCTLFPHNGHPHAIVVFGDEWISSDPKDRKSYETSQYGTVYGGWSIDSCKFDFRHTDGKFLKTKSDGWSPESVDDFPVILIDGTEYPVAFYNLSKLGQYSDALVIIPSEANRPLLKVDDDYPFLWMFNESGLAEKQILNNRNY